MKFSVSLPMENHVHNNNYRLPMKLIHIYLSIDIFIDSLNFNLLMYLVLSIKFVNNFYFANKFISINKISSIIQ